MSTTDSNLAAKDKAVAAFNEQVASWTTPQAAERRAQERAEYEARYEAMTARKRQVPTPPDCRS